MQQVAKNLKKELSIDEVNVKLRAMNAKITMAFGQDFAEELFELMVMAAGIKFLDHPNSPFCQVLIDLEATNDAQTKQITAAEEWHKRLLAEKNSLRGCVSAVRKMAKDIPDGLHNEARRLRDKSEPTHLEQLILACEERFKDILIRTKGVC